VINGNMVFERATEDLEKSDVVVHKQVIEVAVGVALNIAAKKHVAALRKEKDLFCAPLL
jgi:hypothetical protein